ncbi:MAG: glycosyltransferase family 39 protein [Methylococcaceae bacterium]|jgi:4-amino-4-deoxy-L-arabinose transferase-like glycosyltransferase
MLNKIIEITNKHLLLLLGGVFLLRIIYLFNNGLDLIGDESYYWDWSRRPDWCYYSKPPMVAWLIGVFTRLGGDWTAIVRLPAVILGTVFLIYFYFTARDFYNPKAAAIALLLILAMPFNVLANLIMTIDPALYCFWMISLYFLGKALFDKNLLAWVWAGLASGAALLSKQSALLLPLMVFVFILIDKDQHSQLKRGFLLYLAPIMLCMVPLVIWNLQHDWVMLDHSKGHFASKESIPYTVQLTNSAVFVLYQLLLATPVIFVLILLMSVNACFKFTRLNPREQFLMLTGPILLLAILMLSLLQKVQGNWPVSCYFSALILLAGRWVQVNWQKWLKIGMLIGYLMVALTYALPVAIQVFNLHNSVVDPTFRFRHWRELAGSIQTEREKIQAASEQTFILALGHRFLASQLAFYLPDHPRTFRYEASGRVLSQYEVWPGPTAYIGKNSFIISEQSEAEVASEIKSAFQTFKEVAVIANPMNKNSSYHLFIGENMKFWPPKSKQE